MPTPEQGPGTRLRLLHLPQRRRALLLRSLQGVLGVRHPLHELAIASRGVVGDGLLLLLQSSELGMEARRRASTCVCERNGLKGGTDYLERSHSMQSKGVLPRSASS